MSIVQLLNSLRDSARGDFLISCQFLIMPADIFNPKYIILSVSATYWSYLQFSECSNVIYFSWHRLSSAARVIFTTKLTQFEHDWWQGICHGCPGRCGSRNTVIFTDCPRSLTRTKQKVVWRLDLWSGKQKARGEGWLRAHATRRISLPMWMPRGYCEPLLWRHHERDGVSNHRHLYCLPNRLFSRSKKTSKLRVTGLWASNAENVSIWWRHHALRQFDWCYHPTEFTA